MDLSPQSVRSTAFKTVRKGYDPDEVDVFKETVAGAIESAQNQATAMEARARAAVAKLQEVSQQASEGREAHAEVAPVVVAHADDAEIISRTLLLAQRTADTAVAEARAHSDALVNEARTEASAVLDSARTMSARLLDEARVEARRSGEDERQKADSEVQALLARRDFLLSDVDHLEQFLGAQRERLRDAAIALHELVERVPGGLGDIRRPLLSASGDHAADRESDREPDRESAPAASAITAVEAPVEAPPVQAVVDVFATGELPTVGGGDDTNVPLRRVRDLGPGATGERRTAVEPIDDLWTTADDIATPDAAGEATPMHTDQPLGLGLEDTTEVPVTAPPVQRDTLRIIGDELQ